MPLTVKRIEKLTAPGRYPDGGGLYVQVGPSGSRSWLFRYERRIRDADGNVIFKPNGRAQVRERWMGLGSLDTFDLPEARERARANRKLLADGVDPLDAKGQERAAKVLKEAHTRSFRAAAQEFYDEHQAKWRNAKHRAQFLSTLKRYAFPVIGDLTVDSITTEDVIRLFKEKATVDPPTGQSFWLSRPETAQRVRQRIEQVLDWAKVHGFRSGENPARWAGNLKFALPAKAKREVKRHEALPWKETPAFMAELKQREGIAANALQFLILTAARTGEVTGARWDEIDVMSATWTVPAERMKGGREHRVPLSPPALAIIERMPREAAGWVFPSADKAGAPMSNMAFAAVLKRMGRSDITVHGFRSSFRDWAAESTNFPNHVVEMALAHAIGSKVEASYRRGDLLNRRRQLMNAWGSFTETPARPAPAEGENVIAMGAER
jgi:integrase